MITTDKYMWYALIITPLVLFPVFYFMLKKLHWEDTYHRIEEKDVVRTDISYGCCHVDQYNEKDHFKW